MEGGCRSSCGLEAEAAGPGPLLPVPLPPAPALILGPAWGVSLGAVPALHPPPQEGLTDEGHSRLCGATCSALAACRAAPGLPQGHTVAPSSAHPGWQGPLHWEMAQDVGSLGMKPPHPKFCNQHSPLEQLS